MTAVAAVSGGSYIDSSAASIITEDSGVASPDDSPNGEIIITLITPPSPPPTLSILLSSPNLALLWPTSATGFAVFQQTDLSGTNWTAVTNMPEIVNGQNRVLIPGPFTPSCFYRLQSQ